MTKIYIDHTIKNRLKPLYGRLSDYNNIIKVTINNRICIKLFWKYDDYGKN